MVYNNQATLADIDGPGAERFDAAHRALIDELSTSGELVETKPLERVGTLVRRRDGSPQVTEKSFAESTEFVGGYYLVDVVDEVRAVAIAGRLRETETSLIEVRRIEPAHDDSAERPPGNEVRDQRRRATADLG